MHPWFKWLSYIDPLRYAFEALMANEFHGMQASCANLVPSGRGFENVTFANQVCAVTGSTAGSSFVSGDDYIKASFTYTQSHLWRNFGILIVFWVFFSFTYAVATELQKPAGGQGEFLIFKKGRAPAPIQTALEGKHVEDLESGSEGAQNLTEELEVLRVHTTRMGLALLAQSKDIFTWQDVCYDVTVKAGTQRRLLDNVHGYVKPGTLTALMGESGAGKTTLLNVLAQRVDTGIVTGDMLVNGSPLDISFQRQSGYVQQQVNPKVY
jgi:ATP-binding cassette subfamily G (WHITE) protein 2 (SNQ2)